MLQQPDAPNLYWALATLPRPLIDFRPGFEAEFASVYLTYPELRDLDKNRLSPTNGGGCSKRLPVVLRRLQEDIVIARGSVNFGAAARQLEGYPRAKRALIAEGRSAAEVDAMSVPQVTLLYTMHTYDELRDDLFKWMALPYVEARKGIVESDDRLKKAHAEGWKSSHLPRCCCQPSKV